MSDEGPNTAAPLSDLAPSRPPHRYRPGNTSLIELRHVTKTYQDAARSFSALRGIDLQVHSGEFVGIIGKSGSGKSTLINIMTGIDRPTSGEVLVGDIAVHTMNENRTAVWRGRSMGIVFQFFQLLPTLSLMQNLMLPMDFCRMYTPKERQDRAMFLLEQVGMAAQADTLPSAISGGQQQRVAIARALANDPPILVADEPTGNLDSETSETIFALFKQLSSDGKTVVMVTHDNDLAARVDSTIIVADGQVINRYVSSALRTLSLDQLGAIAGRFTPRVYAPGSVIIRQGDAGDQFFILTRGEVEVILQAHGGQGILVDRMQPGQMFGEAALLAGGPRTATVRASTRSQEHVEVMALNAKDFRHMVGKSISTREEFHRILRERLEHRLDLS